MQPTKATVVQLLTNRTCEVSQN